MAASSSRKVSLRPTRLSSNDDKTRAATNGGHSSCNAESALPSRCAASNSRCRCLQLAEHAWRMLPRGFVDIYQGCCILEKASVTTCPDYATTSGGHMSLRTSYPQNNGAQATGTWHQKNREVSW